MGSCTYVASLSAPEVLSVETITIVASRASAFSLPEMELLVASAVVLALLAWVVLARMRQDRHSPAIQK
jgi:hypothetical protein